VSQQEAQKKIAGCEYTFLGKKKKKDTQQTLRERVGGWELARHGWTPTAPLEGKKKKKEEKREPIGGRTALLADLAGKKKRGGISASPAERGEKRGSRWGKGEDQ